jgi:hypothetical protein
MVTDDRKRGGTSLTNTSEISTEDIQAYLASKLLDEKGKYLSRGREFKSLTGKMLAGRLLQSLKLAGEHPDQSKFADAVQDLLFEFELRDKKPPDVTKRYIENLHNAVVATIESNKVNDPEGC